MNKKITAALAGVSIYCVAMTASAEVQNWRLIASVDEIQFTGFVAPDWLAKGKTVTIDYAVNMGAPLSTYDDYPASIGSISFNGQTYAAKGDVFSTKNSLFGLNVSVDPDQAEGINFISFGVTRAPAPGPDLRTLLTQVAYEGFKVNDFLRIDFGSAGSVDLHPTAFYAATIPEPSTLAMILVGGLALSLARYNHRYRRPLLRAPA
jgi:hypothetical protein